MKFYLPIISLLFSLSVSAQMSIFDRFNCEDELKKIECLKPFSTAEGCDEILANAANAKVKEDREKQVVEFAQSSLDLAQNFGQPDCDVCVGTELERDQQFAQDVWEMMEDSDRLSRKSYSQAELADDRAFAEPRLMNTSIQPCGSARDGFYGVSLSNYDEQERMSRYGQGENAPGMLYGDVLELNTTDIYSVYTNGTDRTQQMKVFVPASEVKCGPWGSSITLESDGRQQGVGADVMMNNFIGDESVINLTAGSDDEIINAAKSMFYLQQSTDSNVTAFFGELINLKRSRGSLSQEEFKSKSVEIFDKYLNPQSDSDITVGLFKGIVPGRNSKTDLIKSAMVSNQERCKAILPQICLGQQQVEDGQADSDFGFCMAYNPISSTPSASRNATELNDYQQETFLDWCMASDVQASTEVGCVGRKELEAGDMPQEPTGCDCNRYPNEPYLLCYHDKFYPGHSKRTFHYVDCPATDGNTWGDTIVTADCETHPICCTPEIYEQPQDAQALNACRQVLNRAAEAAGRTIPRIRE